MASQSGSKRQTKQLSIDKKLEIINAVDAGEKKCKVAERYGIPRSTLSTILAHRADIERNAGLAPGRIRGRPCTNDDLDKKLFDWVMSVRANNVPLSGPMLQEKARTEASRLGIDNFHASQGWLHKFKKRWGIMSLKAMGEEASIDPAVKKDWVTKLGHLTAGYDAKNIFNMDEFGLFFKMLPDRTLALKGEKCHGGKRSKERVSVLLCVNSDGSEKLKPLMIGKYAKPRCFKNVRELPVIYKWNPSAWMTSSVFVEWLQSIDAKMGAKNRKILLFIDCCKAHKLPEVSLRNVKVVYFPPNCTSKLQPLDQGVISLVKRRYRNLLVQYMIRQIDANKGNLVKCNLLQSMDWLCHSWDKVTAESIANCFKKAGFVTAEIIRVENTHNVSDEEMMIDWNIISQNLGVTDVAFNDFVAFDDELQTTDDNEEENIDMDNVPEQNTGNEDITAEEEDDDDNSVLTRPTRSEVNAAITTLERYFLLSDDVANTMRKFRDLQSYILKDQRQQMKQMTIDSYFQKQ